MFRKYFTNTTNIYYKYKRVWVDPEFARWSLNERLLDVFRSLNARNVWRGTYMYIWRAVARLLFILLLSFSLFLSVSLFPVPISGNLFFVNEKELVENSNERPCSLCSVRTRFLPCLLCARIRRMETRPGGYFKAQPKESYLIYRSYGIWCNENTETLLSFRPPLIVCTCA